MTPTLHPRLVNGRSGDPALFIELLHRREALLFDLGDLHPLSVRDLLRVTHAFVSHMHMDHLIGFDALLRTLVGRDRTVRLFGPAGLADRIEAKLGGYQWDLVDGYADDLLFDVTELHSPGEALAARFRMKRRFAREHLPMLPVEDGLILTAPGFTVRAAVLEHHGPCLGYALAEPVHVNIWGNRLAERGFAPGPWLQGLKAAVRDGLPDDTPVPLPDGRTAMLSTLRDLVSVEPGQKLAYVTDVADTPANRAAIVDLARGADLLFIEGCFAVADAERARARAHLTTAAAGEIARAAGVRRVESFHFSPRYEGMEEALVAEVMAAFEGPAVEQ